MQKREEKGSISTLVLFTVLMFLAILMGIYLITTALLKSQLQSNLRIQEIYRQGVDNVDEVYEELANAIGENPTKDLLKTVEEAKKAGDYYFDKQTELKDSDGNKVVVPAGFKIAEDSGDNVTEGIVIEDNDIIDEVGEGRGNQYVWIPVSNINKDGSNPIKKNIGEGETENIEITLGRYEFADGETVYKDNEGKDLNNGDPLAEGTEILRQKAEDYADETPIKINSSNLDSGNCQELEDYRPGNTADDHKGENRTAKELGKFIDSVEKNGGYYIARYEASYGENGKPNSKVSINENDSSTAPTQEGYLWNNITEKEAAEACEGMYTTVESDLVNSYAWDTAIVYIQKFSNDSDYSRQNSKNDALANTGVNDDEVCKINDMSSNCREWTTEYCDEDYWEDEYNYPCVVRSGCYLRYGYYDTSGRGVFSVTDCNSYFTFRSTLYIK